MSIQPNPRFRAVDTNTGEPLVGGKLYTYLAGTGTPKATYTDQTLGTANPNPVILDGNGEADVWLGTGGYKFVLADAFDVVLWTVDGIQLPDSITVAALTVTGAATLATVTVTGQIVSTVPTGTAPMVVSSTTKVANLNVDLLDGKDWASPDPIGTTTPQRSVFAAAAATERACLRKGFAGQSANIDEVQNSAGDPLFTVGPTGAVGITGNLTEKGNTLKETANAAQWIRGQISEEITLNTGGTTTDSSADLLPTNSIIEAVVARVTQAITVATDWKLGDATQAARFTAAQSGAQLNLGATVVGLKHADPTVATADLGPVQNSAAKLRITTTGTPAAGKIRCTVFYRQFIAPTS